VIDHANNEVHPVLLTPGCTLAEIMGGTEVLVSSYHHQALDRVGAELQVVGRAPDGCVEAVEHVSAPVVGVQWHPEDNAHEARSQQALFDALVARAADRVGV
jgi:putative glutamine amidotransferase